jgi:citronellyl-CoA dehydrogenase
MAKLFCGRTSRYVADTCIQLHGGFGYMKESAAGRAFVDTRLISIGGGADEVMIHYLAKMLGF